MPLLTPLPKSAAAATRCTPVGVSPATIGTVSRIHSWIGPGSFQLPATIRCRRCGCGTRSRRHRRPTTPARDDPHQAGRPSPGLASGCSGSAKCRRRTRSARTLATSEPSADREAATTETLRPGRSTTVESARGLPTGTGRVSSIVSRVISQSVSSAGACSHARASSAETGPPWQWRGSHGPRAYSVAVHASSAPSGASAGSGTESNSAGLRHRFSGCVGRGAGAHPASSGLSASAASPR